MPRRKTLRSAFGSIIQRKNRQGYVISLEARYTNPLDQSKRVIKSFPLGAKAVAQHWLDEEEKLVDAHMAGTETWTPPKVREAKKAKAKILFRDYSEQFLDTYRTSDGSKLTEASARKKREAIDHLNKYFGDMMVSEIKQQNVEDWLDGDYVDGVHALRRAYQVLKAIVKKALASNEDEPALLDSDPCQRPNPKLPKSRQSMIPPATQEELGLIYNAMPNYSRIAIYLGAVFGLRISEVCALQVCDIDFAHKLLHVRHALTRGDGDTGALSFKGTKTESSNEDLPIPDSFAPLIKEHIKAHCESSKTAMLIPAKHSNIMSPNTLRTQFDEAKLAASRPDLHFHTLRATAITAAAQAGGTPKEVQEYGRHASAKISLALYQRATREGERQLANKVFTTLVKPERTRDLIEAEYKEALKQIQELQDTVKNLETELKEIE